MCEQCGCSHDKAQDTFEQKVQTVIDAIRPNLQSHGGDVELVTTENRIKKGICITATSDIIVTCSRKLTPDC